MLVYNENETLKHENRMLREKTHILEEEINQIGDPRQLGDEIERLNRIM